MTNYKSIQSLNYTVYITDESVSAMYFAISIDSKIISEDTSLAILTILGACTVYIYYKMKFYIMQLKLENKTYWYSVGLMLECEPHKNQRL